MSGAASNPKRACGDGGDPSGETRLHATAIALDHRAVIIRGRSGAGKSDLALRCLSVGPSQLFAGTPRLVADDQVLVTRHGAALRLQAPASLLGKLEVRGLGIIAIEPELDATAVLVCDLAAAGEVDRLPDPWPLTDILGVRLPVLRLAPFEVSAPFKLLVALSMPETLALPHQA